MSETISFRDVKLEGGWLMVKPEREDIGKAMALVRKHKDRLYDMDVKEHRKKRSLDANAMLWSLINQMSVVLRIPPDEIYQGYIPDVGDNFTWHPEKPETVKQFSDGWCRGHIGRMVDDVGPCRLPDLRGYRLLKCYYGSSEYDVPTFSRLLDLVIQDCKNIGIETISERERSLLLEEWGKAHA